MPPTINQEWLNQNSLRVYPFKEDSSLRATNIPEVSLPTSLVVDFIFTVLESGDLNTIYLSQLTHVGNILTLVFSDVNDDLVTSATINLSTHSRNDGYILAGLENYSASAGRLVIGDLRRFKDDVPEGVFLFDKADTAMEVTTIRPDIVGVQDLQLRDSDELSDLITGHVKLLSGTNIRLSYLSTFNAIRIDAISGVGFNQECDCPESVGSAVKRINGIDVADVSIVGDGYGTEVTSNGNTITISNNASSPCCGCPELEVLTTQLRSINANVSRVEELSAQVGQRLNEFVQNYMLTLFAK